MHQYHYTNGQLHCEQTPLNQIAQQYGTPTYTYSQTTIQNQYQQLHQAFKPIPHTICYAVKANPNIAILNTIARLGGGFDIVSQGELQRILTAGGDPQKTIFAGVGKTQTEIQHALHHNILALNAESPAELDRIQTIAQQQKQKAPISIRINPDINPNTHAKITTGTYANKFGIPYEQAIQTYTHAARQPNLQIKGIQIHIGSQLTNIQPYKNAIQKLTPLIQQLQQKHPLQFFSIGGGLGIPYHNALQTNQPNWWQTPDAAHHLHPQTYAQQLIPLLKPLNLHTLIEPGRSIVATAGALLTQIQYIKQTPQKNFLIIDAAMNDLLRPALYDAHHDIQPLTQTTGKTTPYDIVGPICETTDTLCKNRHLPPLKQGDHLALLTTGAYAFTMASNYNTRPRPPEILIHKNQHHPIRPREPLHTLWTTETLPPWHQPPTNQTTKPHNQPNPTT